MSRRENNVLAFAQSGGDGADLAYQHAMGSAKIIATLLLAVVCACRTPAAPVPAAAGGQVSSTGGALGQWKLEVKRCSVAHGGMDLTDPQAPRYVVRVVRRRFESSPNKWQRDVEIHIADLDAQQELLVDPARCSILHAFVGTYAQATGSARFDCDTADGGHVSGDVSFTSCGPAIDLGSIIPPQVEGTIMSRTPDAGDFAFGPSHCWADRYMPMPQGVVLWDVANPRVAMSVEELEYDRSILGGGTRRLLRIFNTSSLAPRPIEIDSERCSVFAFTMPPKHGRGSLRVDCLSPVGGHVKGAVDFGHCD